MSTTIQMETRNILIINFSDIMTEHYIITDNIFMEGKLYLSKQKISERRGALFYVFQISLIEYRQILVVLYSVFYNNMLF